MFRKAASLLLLLLLGLLTVSASAAPRDKAATKKIEEAMFTHFLNTDFDTAEGLLLGTIRACEDKCSAEVKGKAWMYIGVVRGAGRNDAKGAEEAFRSAIKEDPNVELDAQVATDEVKAIFARVKGGGAAATTAPPTKSTAAAAAPAAPAAAAAAPEGAMKCSLEVTEVQSRRPIPVACESDQQLESAKLFFHGVDQKFTSVQMQPVEGAWQATIPCNATQSTGVLEWYVEGFDADNKKIDNYGSHGGPASLDIVDETTQPPPAFADKEPPNRCSVAAEQPKAGGACGGWGDPCGAGDCCEQGLACVSGTCEAAACESDNDCGAGHSCVDGRCKMGAGKTGKLASNWVGLHFGWDLTLLSASGACKADVSEKEHFNCFDGNNTYEGTPADSAGGNISSGFVPSTMRILLSYERLFGPLGLEVRAGYAFGGGKTPKGGSAFLPIHAELRAKYWFMGEEGFKKPGFRPFIGAGGGLAQVDATVDVDILDCSVSTDTTCTTSGKGSQQKTLEATKVLGRSFVTGVLGLEYGIAANHGPVLNVNVMYLLPASGLVLEPSIGYVYGF